MSLNVFLKVVEIQTKLASLFPFIIGVLFSMTYFGEVQWGNTLVFFIGMVVFDMATTAINNYMDFKKAKSDVYKYEENIIGQSGVSPQLVRNMIFAMIAFTAVVGAYLTVQTGWLFLVLGGICCFIGIFYTYGPIPLSRMPLGEIFSGFTMGLGIFVLTVYLNVVNQPPFYLTVDFASGAFRLDGNLWAVLAIVVASLPLVCSIANIMLANNLRDLDTDIENHRYTLVYYIGRPAGIVLFQVLALAGYLVILFGFISGIYQWPVLITFATLPVIWKNIQTFKQELPQPKSFRHSIKNLMVFNGTYALGLFISALLGYAYLTVQTGWLFLVLGGICCFIGIFYTYGPIPLSRMPLGEIFSGFTMGLGIFVLTVYLNVVNQPPFYLTVDFASGAFRLDGNLWAVLAIVVASLPLVCSIANIMLANNLRDLDTDIENHRYTLVYYIGRPAGIVLFQVLALAGYLVILFGFISGIYQWPVLITFATLPVIWKNIQTFKQELPQPKSFRHSIKNLMVFNGTYALGLFISALLG